MGSALLRAASHSDQVRASKGLRCGLAAVSEPSGDAVMGSKEHCSFWVAKMLVTRSRRLSDGCFSAANTDRIRSFRKASISMMVNKQVVLGLGC